MLIRCPRCGREISNNAVQCPGCGLQFSPIPGNFSKSNLLRQNLPSCPECGSYDLVYETVKEPIPLDTMTVILYIILALTCCGILVLIPILLSPRERIITYATCRQCGNRWKIS